MSQSQKTTLKMPKRPLDTVQSKKSRSDRINQMSQQELLIEQKKREIQAKLESKRRQNNLESAKSPKITTVESPPAPKEIHKAGVNQFSNDGSFLDQFKQIGDKKNDTKFKTFKKYRELEREREKEKEKEREKERENELGIEGGLSETKNEGHSLSPNHLLMPPLFSADQPPPNFDPQKMAFDTSFTSNPPPMVNFNQPPHISQSGLENTSVPLLPLPNTSQVPPLINDFQVPTQLNFAPPDNLNFTAPPQLSSISAHINTNLAPPTAQIITSTVTQQINPPLIQGIVGAELTTPTGQIGSVNLSTSAPVLQPTQTVMTQALAPPTHLFTTTTGTEQQVLLNVPPPQILPQTQLVITPQDQNVLVSAPASILTTVTLPPPVIAPQNINVSTQSVLNVRPPVLPTVELTSIPPPNPIQVQNIPPPEPINTLNIPPPAPLQVSSIPTPSSLQLNEIPNPKPLDVMTIPTPSENDDTFADASFLKNIPPPNKSLPPPNLTDSSSHSRKRSSPPPRIPSLMSQRVLPPPGMALNIPPPPVPSALHSRDVSQPPPNFNRQGLPPMLNTNVPPPMIGSLGGPPPKLGLRNEIAGGAEFEAMVNLARMVAECGSSVEDIVRQKKNRDPELWFLFHKDSAAYRQYANLVDQYRRDMEDARETETKKAKPDPSEIYEPEMALEDDDADQDYDDYKEDIADVKKEIKQEDNYCSSESSASRRERKRKSRWGEKEVDVKPPIALPIIMNPSIMPPVPGSSTMLTKVTRNDPGLIQYAIQSYGSAQLSEEDWKKAEDNYKIHLLYQDMMKKKEELQKLQRQGRNKYEYDSDEETEGGTWEHKLRDKEMQATELWAVELTKQAEGKHHIGDFLPPEELNRFMEKSNALKEGRQPNFSDYKEFKIKEDNIGFKMLQKLGWSEGEGLGQNSSGIVEPINKGAPRENTQGLGLNLNEATQDEDEYDSYRKRMMLAYRFRPNPLNNPRRPYY